MEDIKQAAILVGGLGSRLGALTRSTPKPLLIVDGKKFIDHILLKISETKIQNVVLLAGFLGEQFYDSYHNKIINNTTVQVSIEKKPLGTGGALLNSWDMLMEDFMLLNGDSIMKKGYKDFLQSYSSERTKILIGLLEVFDHSRFGLVKMDGNIITEFNEKCNLPQGAGLINSGCYIIKKSIIKEYLKQPCSLEKDVFPILSAQKKIEGIVLNSPFIDIGINETVNEINHRADKYI